MSVPRLLLAIVLGGVGGWIGTNLAYVNHNPLYDGDPVNGTAQTRTADNAWKWWAGLMAGGFVGASLPYLRKPDRR